MSKPYTAQSDPGQTFPSCPLCALSARSVSDIGHIVKEYAGQGGMCRIWQRKYRCNYGHNFTVQWTTVKREGNASG